MMNYLLTSSFATIGRGWSDCKYHCIKLIWVYWHLRGIVSLFVILWKYTLFSVIPFLKHVRFYQPWLSLQHMLFSMGHLFPSQTASSFYRLMSTPKLTLSEGKGIVNLHILKYCILLYSIHWICITLSQLLTKNQQFSIQNKYIF